MGRLSLLPVIFSVAYMLAASAMRADGVALAY
jgi:hypothetical protein